ncbi:alpha/beta-hydrolase [Didymella exigua CBS 183.55]|uniref:Alpha/beta-hydrolase n=1 Tax=Didymella exigua CBS 183.55 TaxID=1150837 RepID=A0A6A5RK17_9PLEO|nr:alpha/beta-hydrolase [Didymella exigua CBS 183.55]KAF1926766.1 alpha/beta-hydrolase [Didymella exigua CBS 183.55]
MRWYFEWSRAIGSIVSIVLPGDQVVQFHGIPYAAVPRRFKQSTLLENLNGTHRNFKFPGFACPHSFTMADDHSGGLYPNEQIIEVDELACLTVTLSIPLQYFTAVTAPQGSARQNPGQQEGGKRMPVMAYIHGGAFHVGKADAVHDTAPLVSQSIDDAQPVIAASLQYRIGALGFLATPDGGVNLGLCDQRTGLEWLQRFIGGFGGDESRVTMFGESAGGFSICCHMLGRPSARPLFNRAVIMSGVLGPLMVPVSQSEAGNAFNDICEILGIEETGRAALEKLESVPVQRLVEAGDTWTARGNFWRPVVDPSFFAHADVSWDAIPRLLADCPWVGALIVGNTASEGTPYSALAASLTPASFRAHISAGLSEQATDRVMQTYGIEEGMDHTLFALTATRYLGDVVFDAPIHALCSHLSSSSALNDTKLYRYIFAVPNPFPGASFHAVPHHWVDVYFLFRTLQFRFPNTTLKKISDEHARLWVRFAHGQAPWGECGEGGVMVADAVQGWKEMTLEEDEQGNGRDLARLGRLWDAWAEKRGDAAWAPVRVSQIIAAQEREEEGV